jgi:hypothetical protein
MKRLWTLSLSPGSLDLELLIMGPEIAFHILMGAIVGWLSYAPLPRLEARLQEMSVNGH